MHEHLMYGMRMKLASEHTASPTVFLISKRPYQLSLWGAILFVRGVPMRRAVWRVCVVAPSVKDKAGPHKEIYPYLIQELRPTLDELGISTPEELGIDKI